MLNSPTQNNCFLKYPHVFFISMFCENFSSNSNVLIIQYRKNIIEMD